MVVVPAPRRTSPDDALLRRPLLRRVGRALLAAVQFAVLAVATALVCAHFLVGLSLHAVLSNSMQPTFSAGDYLVTVDQDALSLQAGQVPLVTFENGVTRAHRILQVMPERGTVRILTQGDANPTADLWTAVDAEAPVPVVVTTLSAVPSWITSFFGVLHANPLSAAVAIALGGLALTGWAIRRQVVRLRDCLCDECVAHRETTRDDHDLTAGPASQTQEIR